MKSSKIRCIIIDDDPFIVDLLKDKIDQYIPGLVVSATAENGHEGIKLILDYKPNLIFLDVEMADMTGFEMLATLKEIRFQTIFITSYSHYAIKAIKFNALDYLVKPIDLGELKQAITRYKKRAEKNGSHHNMELALHNFRTSDVSEHRLVLQTQEGELSLELQHIIRVEGERNYSFIHLEKQKKKLVSKTLGELEELLDDKGFFRCHKSHLVNYKHIHQVTRTSSVLMSDKTEVPVSRRKKEDFKSWYENARQHLGA